MIMLASAPAGKHNSTNSTILQELTNVSENRKLKTVLIREVTRLLADVLGKNPQTTVVVVEAVDTDNWGIGGQTVTKLRQGVPDVAEPK